MDVKVTEHVVEPTPPPKTYDVEFKGLTVDEFVILRCALTDGTTYRGKLQYRHVHNLKVALDTASPGAYNLMMDNIDRILES